VPEPRRDNAITVNTWSRDNVGFQMWNYSKVLSMYSGHLTEWRSIVASARERGDQGVAQLDTVLAQLETAVAREETIYLEQLAVIAAHDPGVATAGSFTIFHNCGDDHELMEMVHEVRRRSGRGPQVWDLVDELRALVGRPSVRG